MSPAVNWFTNGDIATKKRPNFCKDCCWIGIANNRHFINIDQSAAAKQYAENQRSQDKSSADWR